MNVKILFLLLCFFVQSDEAVHQDLILGNWLAADKKLIIQCYKRSDGTCHGKIVWFARKFTDTADVEGCALPI